MSRRCWMPLGPACVRTTAGDVLSGAVLAVAVDGNDDTGRTVYAASATGGIWKTTDEGITWRPIGDNLPITAVGTFAVGTMLDSSLLLAGTGDSRKSLGLPGLGIMRSGLDGAIWDRVSYHLDLEVTMPPPRVTAVAIDSTLREMWAATEHGLFWRRTDEINTSWKRVVDAQGRALPGPFTSVAIAANAVLAGRGGEGAAQSGDGIYTTPRDGADVKAMVRIAGTPDALPAVTKSARVFLAVAPSDRNVVYALFASHDSLLPDLFRSPDSGATWAARNSPGVRRDVILPAVPVVMTVHPADPNRLYVGNWVLMVSFDGGAIGGTWIQVTDAEGPIFGLAFAEVAPHHAWLATDKGLYFSATEGLPQADRESTWQLRNRGLAAVPLHGLAQHPSDPSILLGAGVERGALRWRNHPLWQPVHDKRVHRVAIDPNEPTTWYAISDFKVASDITAVHQSKDGGTTWKSIHHGLAFLDRADICPLALDPSQKGVAYLGTENLWRRDDAHPELGWVEIARTARTVVLEGLEEVRRVPLTAIAVAPSDPNVVYAGARNGDVYRAVFDPQTAVWNLFGPFRLSNSSQSDGISSLAVSPTNPQVVFATVGYPPLAARTNEKENFKVERRLQRSDDGGQTWTSIFILIPNERVFFHKILIHPDDERLMFLATDQGVMATAFSETINDHVFRDITANLPRAPVADLLLFPPGRADPNAASPPQRRLRVATFGRGAWERVLGEPDGPCRGADIFLRDTVLDTGDAPTPEVKEDPLEAGKQRKGSESVDLKVDRLDDDDGEFETFESNRDYVTRSAAAAPDFIALERFRSNRVHAAEETHVYLQIHSRGPDTEQVRARVLFARPSAEASPLPADPFGAIAASEAWQPIGDVQEVEVRPGEPAVAQWTQWNAPADLKQEVLLVAVIAPPGGSLALPPGTVREIARASNRVTLRSLRVEAQEQPFKVKWWWIAVGVGVVGGVVVGAIWGDDIYRKLRRAAKD